MSMLRSSVGSNYGMRLASGDADADGFGQNGEVETAEWLR
jgi:hypothetical protein